MMVCLASWSTRNKASHFVEQKNSEIKSWNSTNVLFDNRVIVGEEIKIETPKITVSVDFDRTLADAYQCTNTDIYIFDLVHSGIKALIEKKSPDMQGSSVTSGAADKGFEYKSDENRYISSFRSPWWHGCGDSKGIMIPAAGGKLQLLQKLSHEPVQVVSYGPSGYARNNIPAKVYATLLQNSSDWKSASEHVFGQIKDKGQFLLGYHGTLSCHVHFDDAALHVDQVNSVGGIAINVNGETGVSDADIRAALGALFLRGCLTGHQLQKWINTLEGTSESNLWKID